MNTSPHSPKDGPEKISGDERGKKNNKLLLKSISANATLQHGKNLPQLCSMAWQEFTTTKAALITHSLLWF